MDSSVFRSTASGGVVFEGEVENLKVVEAKLSGFPYWPALGYPPASSGGTWNCVFFGTYDFAPVSGSAIKVVSSEADLPKASKAKTKALAKARREAAKYYTSSSLPVAMTAILVPGDDAETSDEIEDMSLVPDEYSSDNEAAAERSAFRSSVMHTLGLSTKDEVVTGEWRRDLVRRPGGSSLTLFAQLPPHLKSTRKSSKQSSTSGPGGAGTKTEPAAVVDDDLEGLGPEGSGFGRATPVKTSGQSNLWSPAELQALIEGVRNYRGPDRGKWVVIHEMIKDQLQSGRQPSHLSRKWLAYARECRQSGKPCPKFVLQPTKKRLSELAPPSIKTKMLWDEGEYLNLINAVRAYGDGPPKGRWHAIVASCPGQFKPFRRPTDLGNKWSRHLANLKRMKKQKDPASGITITVPHLVAEQAHALERKARTVTEPKLYGPEWDIPEEELAKERLNNRMTVINANKARRKSAKKKSGGGANKSSGGGANKPTSSTAAAAPTAPAAAPTAPAAAPTAPAAAPTAPAAAPTAPAAAPTAPAAGAKIPEKIPDAPLAFVSPTKKRKRSSSPPPADAPSSQAARTLVPAMQSPSVKKEPASAEQATAPMDAVASTTTQ